MSNQETRELARGVAAELGPDWRATVEPGQEDWPGVYLVGPDQAKLYLRGVWNDAGRLQVSGGYPQNHGRPQVYSITVARTRGATVIAREITRRLLPSYLKTLAEVIADIERDRQAAERRAYNAGELAKLIPGATVRDDPRSGSYNTEVRWYDSGTTGRGYGELQLSYHGDGVSVLEIRSISVETAERILRALTQQ